MKILFLHGWHSTPGGVKPVYLRDHGHEVLNPALPDDDFDAAVRIGQAEFDEHQPDVVVGSSRGGAVAMNIETGGTPLVLLCPAWKRWGTATKVKQGTAILHSRLDDVVPFADSEELVRNSGLPLEALIEIGTEHRLADEESLARMLEAVEEAFPLEPELKMMLETTARLSPLRPPALARQFGVPRQFGIGTLLVITAMYAVLFGVLRSVGPPPVAFGVVALFFTLVGLGQAILFKGMEPRLASMIVGACFFLCWFLAYPLLWPNPNPRPRLSLGDYLLFSALASLFGASLGYISGFSIAGVFLVFDKLGHLRGKPKEER